ncbi:ankyrin repeat domain-containing protein [Actinobacillus genomosp. 1]|uniref:ankyrin repeat domain-containing protein n=1 Tax=Actinobacillus genomosp. 1 TaxID=254839 RepID=UPI002442E540|nr:ankyrin repeat domain-containing protein [Actinobacillus genomosp. 1]WGE91001.1 ankyrin repeat domain-containing protein [Actinobacillus genomosp. 1]
MKDEILPRNFQEIINTGDINLLQDVFQECDINAFSDYITRKPALSYRNIPILFAQWLIENGADVNATTNEDMTPLHYQTMYLSDVDILDLLIANGADIHALDRHKNTPLHYALNPVKAELLLKHGANPTQENLYGEMPLEAIFSRCGGYPAICDLSESSELLIQNKNVITEDMVNIANEICIDAERYKNYFDEKDLLNVEKSILLLRKLFDVTPVLDPKHFNNLPKVIVLNGKTHSEKYNELWHLLVPKKGAASTVQGEIIRIVSRVSDEINCNGGMNWDKHYKQMLDFLIKTFKTGNSLNKEDILFCREIKKELNATKNCEQDKLEHLSLLAVMWVMNNPSLIQLTNVTYSR